MVPHDSSLLPELFPRRQEFSALVRKMKGVLAKAVWIPARAARGPIENQWDYRHVHGTFGNVARVRSITIFDKFLYSAADSNFCL
jgi:hypothetical protein